MATSLLGLSRARAICVCVPSPQSNNSHSPSRTTAIALTLRRRVGLPELVPSGMTFMRFYNSTPHGQRRMWASVVIHPVMRYTGSCLPLFLRVQLARKAGVLCFADAIEHEARRVTARPHD